MTCARFATCRLGPCVLLAVLMLFSADPAAAQADDELCSRENYETSMHYSLYFENYKNENEADALLDLHWILTNCPGFPTGRDGNFERGVEIYERLAEKTEDAAQQRIYLDSALVLLNRAVPTLQEAGGDVDEFEWLIKKGRFIQTHIDALDDRKREALDAYRAAYDLDRMRLDAYYIDVLLSDLYQQRDIEGMLEILRQINEARGEEDAIQALYDKYRSVIPAEELIAFLEARLDADPTNLKTLKEILGLYRQMGMTDEWLAISERILEVEVDARLAREVIGAYLKAGRFEEAEALFERLQATEGFVMQPADFLNMGYAQLGAENYPEALGFYRLALDADAAFQPARQAIADLYGTLVAKCGIGERTQKAVFWLVADAYQRAGDAAGVARYRAAFPTVSEIHFEPAWTPGATVSVSYGCRGVSISGSTMVRASNG